MRLLPRSLRGRLMALSSIATIAALAVAAFLIGAVLERFVMQGLDQRLDGQIALLATAVRPDGSVDRARIVSPAPYSEPGSGWSWRIELPVGGPITSPGESEPVDAVRALHLEPRGPGRDGPERGPERRPGPGPGLGARADRRSADDQPVPFEWQEAGGNRRHARILKITRGESVLRIVASAPRAIVARPIRAAMVPLIGALALLGLALMVATIVQLRVGLRPLARLRDALAAVRAGHAQHVPIDQPEELRPLAIELNALLDANTTQLRSARGHVANLAHGIKTPLATMMLHLREDGRDPDGRLGAEVARIDRAVRHHLGRARSDVSGGGRARTELGPAIAGLARALGQIHAGRGIVLTRDIAPDLHVAVDAQDLDEMLGNLLDNAWRHAAHGIDVTARAVEGRVRVAISDDGPGIAPERRALAVEPGRRLDETGEGYGFGLSIVRELAELHGGGLALEDARGGGLVAIVSLPSGASARDMG